MVDREKVIKGLETIKQFFGYGLPSTAEMFDSYYGTLNDAIALLKEQEDAYQGAEELLRQKTILFDDAIKRLKGQDAVEPKTGHWDVFEYCANEGIYCSKCHIKVFDRTTKPKKKLSQYCPHCGSKNEQFFRDGGVVFR